MAGGERRSSRKRKVEQKSEPSKRRTRSSASAAAAEEAMADRKSWTMYQGYDKTRNKMLLQNYRSDGCSEMVEVQLPPKVMDLQEIAETGRINSYSKTSYMQTITQVLHDSPLYEVLQRSNLFSVFRIPVKRGALSGKLVHNMLGRMLMTRKKYELWFVFGNRPIKYSLREFALVTGLDCGQYPMSEEEWDSLETKASSNDGYWWELFGPLKLTQGVTKDIQKFLLADKAKPRAKQISDETRLRLCLVLLVDGVLCCKNCAASKASPTTVELTRDIDRFLKFPWGRLAFELSLEMVRVGTSSNPSVEDYMDRYNGTHVPMKGFPIAFQLVFLKAIPALNNHLAKPKKDTNYADPKLKADDLKDSREIKNDTIENLDNDPETDIYSIVNHGYELVSSELSWDDEVDDPSVDLLGILLGQAYVFKSSDWVKGRIHPIHVTNISRFGKSERLPTKKVSKKGKGKGVELDDLKTEITELSSDEYEPDEENKEIMEKVKEAVSEWESDVLNYQKTTKKIMLKKVEEILKENRSGGVHGGVHSSADNVRAMEKPSLHDSDSDSYDINQEEDLPSLEKRKGKRIAQDSISSGKFLDEDMNLENPRDEEMESVMKTTSFFEHVEEAMEMVKNLGDPEAGLEDTGDRVDVEESGNQVNVGTEEEDVMVETVKVTELPVDKASDAEETNVQINKDSVVEEEESNVQMFGGSDKHFEGENVKEVETKGPVSENEDVAVKKSVNDAVDGKDNPVDVSEIAGKRHVGDNVKDVKEKAIRDAVKNVKEKAVVKQSQVESIEKEIPRPRTDVEEEDKAVAAVKKTTEKSGCGGKLVKKDNAIKTGLDPIPEQLKEAFLRKLNTYMGKFYDIEAERYPNTIFEEIYKPRAHSTNTKIMGLLIESMWSRLRTKLEQKRVIIYGPFFPGLLEKEYKRVKEFTENHARGGPNVEFVWGNTISNIMRGVSTSRPGKNMWAVDVDRIYAPMIWSSKKHWVALCINLVNGTVSVFDSHIARTSEEEMQEIMSPVVSVLPYLMETLAKKAKTSVKWVKEFRYGRPPVSCDSEYGNSGPFSLKFIEMHAQGLSLKGITTEMVPNFRMNYAIELYERHVMPVV